MKTVKEEMKREKEDTEKERYAHHSPEYCKADDTLLAGALLESVVIEFKA